MDNGTVARVVLVVEALRGWVPVRKIFGWVVVVVVVVVVVGGGEGRVAENASPRFAEGA